MDELDQRIGCGDPAGLLTSEVDRQARASMRAVVRGRRRVRGLRLTVLSTVALLVVGGGAAVAAPLVHSIFDPDVTAVNIKLESDGAGTRCTASFETSIKLGNTDRHQAAMRALKDYVTGRSWTVHVPADATRAQVLRAMTEASNRVREGFDAGYAGEDLTNAADVFQLTRCSYSK